MGGGWLVGNYSENNATSWIHLASWNLPDFELSWESKMESSVATTLYKYWSNIGQYWSNIGQIFLKFCIHIVKILLINFAFYIKILETTEIAKRGNRH